MADGDVVGGVDAGDMSTNSGSSGIACCPLPDFGAVAFLGIVVGLGQVGAKRATNGSSGIAFFLVRCFSPFEVDLPVLARLAVGATSSLSRFLFESLLINFRRPSLFDFGSDVLYRTLAIVIFKVNVSYCLVI